MTTIPLSIYVYIDNSDTKIYSKHYNTTTIKTLADNDVMQIRAVANLLTQIGEMQMCIIQTIQLLGHNKNKTNPNIKYKFYNCDGVLWKMYTTGFAGEKIFGYKVGTGTFVDPEIGHVLSYKDTPKGAEYEFENYLITKEYKQSYQDSVKNLRYSKPLVGYNYIKRFGNLETFYKSSGILTGAKETKQYEITQGDTELTIPIGKNNWRPTEEYNIIIDNNTLVLVKRNSDGTYNKSLKKTRHLVGVNPNIYN